MAFSDFEDLNVFFQDFGISAKLHLSSGVSKDIVGILEDPSQRVELGRYVQEDFSPVFLCKTEDVASANRSDTLVINTETYTLSSGPVSNGTGLSRLSLAKDTPSMKAKPSNQW